MNYLSVVASGTPARAPKSCRTCLRWYGGGVDQCHVPACGIAPVYQDKARAAFARATGGHLAYGGEPDTAGALFLRDRLRHIHHARRGALYGHPSELNFDGRCRFHLALPRPLRFLTRVARFVFVTWEIFS